MDQRTGAVRGPWVWALLPALLVFAVIAGAQLSVGAIYVVAYGGDVAFLMDTIARVGLGQVPHVDFGLHLGALPFYLIAGVDAWLPGQAFLVAQCLYVAACLLAALWLVRTRLNAVAGAVLMLGIVLHGTAITRPTSPEVSLVVFYNRWAWLAAYLFLTAVLIDPRDGKARGLEGALLGGLAFVLFATKITFFAALVPLGLARYVVMGRWREVGAALAVFAVLLAGGLLADPSIWVGYVSDLIWVAGNPIRQAPGMGLGEMLVAPVLVFYSLAFVVFLGLVWQTLGAREAVWLALAGMAFAFIQHQNHANLPFWVLILAVYAWRVAGHASLSRPARVAWVVLALVLTGLGARLYYPITLGTVVNRLAADTGVYRPFLAGSAAMEGVFLPNKLYATETTEVLAEDGPVPPFAGETECDHDELWTGHFLAQARVMAELPGQVFVADAMTPHWLAAGKPPLQGAATWNYGSLRGLENAAFVLVPRCAIKPNYKREILRSLVREEVPLELFRETADATVYRVLGTASE